MTLTQAFVLGLVQGLGEFLPISSSAHLVVTPWLFGWHDPGLTFDVALHVGTLLAVVGFFWRDWVSLISHGLRFDGTREGGLFWLLVIATIPGAAAGYTLEKYAESAFRAPALVALMLALLGAILYAADRRGQKHREVDQIRLLDAIWIGISQAFAIIPGVSRSGATMTMGLVQGLTREAAARFSFLMIAPITAGAALLKLRHLTGADLNAPFIVGTVTSAVVGALSIKFLLGYLQRHSFRIFAWYRLAFAAVILLVITLRA